MHCDDTKRQCSDAGNKHIYGDICVEAKGHVPCYCTYEREGMVWYGMCLGDSALVQSQA